MPAAAGKLSLAMKTIGIGLAITFGSYLISKIIPNTNKASEGIDELAQKFDQLKGSATFTAKELEDYNRSIEGMDLLGIADRQREIQQELVDLEKEYRDATNETTRDILGAKVDALSSEEQILRNIVALRGAENIASGKFSESFLEDQMRAAKMFVDAREDYEDVMGTEYIPSGIIGDITGIQVPAGIQNLLTERDEERERVTEAMENLPFLDPRFQEGTLFFDLALQAENTNHFIELMEEAGLSVESMMAGMSDLGGAIEQDFIGPIEAARQTMQDFGNEREELFFGGQYGNITGSLYKQVVTQGVGTLYNKQEIIVSNVFHGFFNEQEAALRISSIVEKELDMRL